MENTNTMRGVLWSKVVAYVDAHSLAHVARTIGLAFIAGVLSAAVVNLDLVTGTIVAALRWRNNALPLSGMIFVAVMYSPRILGALQRVVVEAWGSVQERRWSTDETIVGTTCTDTIEGIPTGELVDHLFEAKSFKRADVEEKFAAPRYRVERLAAKLEEIGVLERGENNARILAASATRKSVAAMLAGNTEAADLERELTIVRPIPSSAAPIFTRRMIAQTASASGVQGMCNV